MNKFKIRYPEYDKHFNTQWAHADNITFREASYKFILFLLDELGSDSKNLFIVEGAQLNNYYYTSFLKTRPLIIKETGIIKSYMNQIKRTFDKNTDDGMGHNIPQLIRTKKYLNDFKEKIMEASVTESALFGVKQSNISGKGIFAKTNIDQGVKIGLAFRKNNSTGNPDKDYVRTELGVYVNHSNNPNIIFKKK